ncbi:hypothetical protein HanPSC8_Chr14g0613511 [Helianthus annuus]|nr:hypothetical protein HanPSC8_Chr14g0613511 [Helianthus annuus]
MKVEGRRVITVKRSHTSQQKKYMYGKQKDVKKVVKKDMNVRNNKRKQVETPNKGVGEVRMAKNRRLSTSKVGDKDDNVVDEKIRMGNK